MRLNDKQLRASFLLLQKMTRENEKSTERVEQLEEARGFDRELMMAMIQTMTLMMRMNSHQTLTAMRAMN